MKRFVAVIFGALIVTSVPAHAGPAEEALVAQEAGDHAAAISHYEEVVGKGLVNGNVFYNLGISHFRLGHISDAVAAFLAARRFLPRDPDVAANLRFALGKISDRLDADVPRGASAPFDLVLDAVTARELALVFGVLFGIIGLGVAATVVKPSLIAARRGFFLASGVPLLVLGLLAMKVSRQEVWGAVASGAKTSVYAGPGEDNTVLFELHEGAPVLVSDRGTGGFLKIQLSDGKSGWIAGSQVKIFGPQFGAL